MLGRVLGESVPPGSFVSRDGVVGGGGAVAAEARGKATPRLFTSVRKTGRSRTLGPATTSSSQSGKAPFLSLC